jgi:hypothetical protein
VTTRIAAEQFEDNKMADQVHGWEELFFLPGSCAISFSTKLILMNSQLGCSYQYGMMRQPVSIE